MGHGPKGNFGLFEGKQGENLRNRRGHAIKIGLHAFKVNLYLHEFFEPILFFDPHGLYIVHGPNGSFGRFEFVMRA